MIIGILLAFQLNKCSSDSKQQQTIKIHLEQIKEETKVNKHSLEFSLALVEANTAKLDTIFLLLNQGENYQKINQLSIELLNLGGTYFRKNAFQSLIESGDIRFVNEFKVKQRIINLYEYYKWVESFDEISRNLYIQDYYPYLRNNFDLLTAQKQEEEIYQSKLFKNILGAYKRTNTNRIQKYKDCLEEIDKFLNIQK